MDQLCIGMGKFEWDEFSWLSNFGFLIGLGGFIEGLDWKARVDL